MIHRDRIFKQMCVCVNVVEMIDLFSVSGTNAK